jgi:hypothetical protein
MGSFFGKQKSLPAEYWLMLYNDLITIAPIFCPVWSSGRTFRVDIMKWATPVYDRFDLKDVLQIFNGEHVRGRFTNEEFFALHQKFSIAWNRHAGKTAITLEIRLNEQHPYWLFPALEVINQITAGTFKRFKSLKLDDQPVLTKKIWSACVGKDIYNGLLSVKNVNFLEGRGISFLSQEKFSSALDLFRAIFRKFAVSKRLESIHLAKVCRLFSDFIDFDKVPTHLLWDINSLYNLVYEVPNCRQYQDKYLFYGSKPVIPLTIKLSDNNTVKKLLE